MSAGLYIGVLSGTSVDGVDAVLARFAPRLEVLASHTLPYPESLRAELLALAIPGQDGVDQVGAADVQVAHCFAQAVRELLVKAGVTAADVRAIGSHGQTIRHRPGGVTPFTLQIGDPNRIAAETGVPVVADFRRKDLALGGQGAPLVPAFHAALFRDAAQDRFIVNVGGIANITVLPADPRAPVRGFDTGPGNTLLDAWCRRHTGDSMDRDGRWAAGGKSVPALLAALLADPYFSQPAPKSTGPEYFSAQWLQATLDRFPGLAAADVQATLVELTARSIAQAVAPWRGAAGAALHLCGGGAHNPELRRTLTLALPGVPVDTTVALGVPVGLVEGLAFAWLARQYELGLPGNLPTVTGASRLAVLGGYYPAA